MLGFVDEKFEVGGLTLESLVRDKEVDSLDDSKY